ncbi:hypothetical protein SU52_03915 [Haemophilus influenzae]|nr:hypothetical protein SU52_03915 [Haemophilus influenzae]KIP40272.1 hypothetical protein SU54_05660 [Haemophilus influenzae]KIP44952.1 hypothetical protein SU57_03905 [Haemophilus influenzae]
MFIFHKQSIIKIQYIMKKCKAALVRSKRMLLWQNFKLLKIEFITIFYSYFYDHIKVKPKKCVAINNKT